LLLADKPVDLSSKLRYILKTQGCVQLTKRASKGFDRGFAAGEAIRMQCVKWQK